MGRKNVAGSTGFDTTHATLQSFEGIATVTNCNKEGFNAVQPYSKMCIGFAMNGEADCNTVDKILGFGNESPGTHPWAAWAVVGGGTAGSNTQVYGWIMVR